MQYNVMQCDAQQSIVAKNKQTFSGEPMLFRGWSITYGARPTSTQLWFDVWYVLGINFTK